MAVSAAATFIRLAEASAIAVAFWRCALCVAVLLPLAMVRRERMPRGRTLWVGFASGVVLGGHFGFWISSLDYTSVAASVVLVTPPTQSSLPFWRISCSVSEPLLPLSRVFWSLSRGP